MPRRLSVEIVQEAPAARQIDVNLKRVIELVTASSADVVLLPELFLTGYELHDLDELAMTPQDARIQLLADACRDAGRGVVVGYIEVNAPKPYNAMLVVDERGEIVASVRKTHLFGTEPNAFAPGDRLEPVTLAGIRVGIVNCFELEFPEVCRTLALRGAEVFLAGSANMEPYYDDHLIAGRARALENDRSLAYANRSGEESGFVFCGGSRAISRRGEVLAQLPASGDAAAVVELECVAAGDVDGTILAQRRPELYER